MGASLVTSQRSRSEYDRRMHRVLEHIDRHLDEPLELEALAAVANLSPFHFHRLFSLWMGETLGEYMRRRRLELAAMRLVTQPELPVLNVALSVGFGSTEAFARAFKARFGRAPTSWRSHEIETRTAQRAGLRRIARVVQSKRGQANGNPNQAKRTLVWEPLGARLRAREAPMKVKIIDRQPTTVAYFRHVGPYGLPVSDFWQTTVYPWLEVNNLLGCARFGISHDDPSVTAPEKCRYDACVEVPAGFVGAGKHLTTIVPGGKYAVASFKGTVAEIAPAWASGLRDWLPGSGMQLDSRPCFEYYPREAAHDPQTAVFDCEICIPITPL
jgi:AraC family transcriptional regulator